MLRRRSQRPCQQPWKWRSSAALDNNVSSHCVGRATKDMSAWHARGTAPGKTSAIAALGNVRLLLSSTDVVSVVRLALMPQRGLEPARPIMHLELASWTPGPRRCIGTVRQLPLDSAAGAERIADGLGLEVLRGAREQLTEMQRAWKAMDGRQRLFDTEAGACHERIHH